MTRGTRQLRYGNTRLIKAGIHSKFIVKVQNLKDLNDKAYDSRVEENIYVNLTKAENTAACLGQIAHYLTQMKYEIWEDNGKEVQEMDAEVAALWKDVSTEAHGDKLLPEEMQHRRWHLERIKPVTE